MTFTDRRDAGRQLAEALQQGGHRPTVVLALPRGGVPVAVEVAALLGAQLDVLVVRKLGLPGQPELAMGAIGEDGVRVMNAGVVRQAGVTAAAVERVVQHEAAELDRRVQAYRGGRPAAVVEGRDVVVVDDGLATGATAQAAVEVVRAHGARHVTLAVPVGSREAVARLAAVADDVVCPDVPRHFRSVGDHYADFTQVEDATVVRLLAGA